MHSLEMGKYSTGVYLSPVNRITSVDTDGSGKMPGQAKARVRVGWAKNRARDVEIVCQYGEGERLSDLAARFELSCSCIREIVLQHRGYDWPITSDPVL